MNWNKHVTTAALVTVMGLGSAFSGEKMVGLEERMQMYPDSTITNNQDSIMINNPDSTDKVKSLLQKNKPEIKSD